MKAMIRKTLAMILTLVMVISLFPATAHAYVGAMTEDTPGVTAGSQNGYSYLTNDYIGFYILPNGTLATVPSQKTLSDVKKMGRTEVNVFYKQTRVDPEAGWETDFNTAMVASSSSVTIDSSDPDNPKLKQILVLPDYNTTVTLTYELVRLDKGADTGTVGAIVEKDGSDNGRTWGVLASATASGSGLGEGTRLLWETGHINFGSIGHNHQATIRLDRYNSSGGETSFYSAKISPQPSYTSAEGVSEVYTDSFSYANQFVAMQGYVHSMGWASDGHGGWIGELYSGIRGHYWGDYASGFSYPSSDLRVEHEFSGINGEANALWGFRDLYPTGESGNIPADPVSIATDATCVGIINNNGALSACAAKNEETLKSSYGSKLVAVFRGTFKQESGRFVFTNGAAQLSPSLTATWTEGGGGLTVAPNGTVTARNVHLSAPTFKFYKPKSNDDTSLAFDFSGGKLSIGITPGNNGAILHIDIPGATCRVEEVTADLSGGLVFSGEMSISTPALEAANLTLTRLGMGWSNNRFSLAGIEASGTADMSALLGLDVGSATADINSFPGEERYAFDLELDVFDMFEAKGDLELKRIYNGALIPNTLKLRAASEAGIPLVPPVVVAELNGLGGGFEGLADTINSNFFAIPPLRLTVSAKGSVLEIIDGWYTILAGAGYYKASLTEGTLLGMPIIDEYSWYTELSGEERSYGGVTYKGLKAGGGMIIDLVIPNSDMPFIEAGGEFNASAFAGLNDYTSPTKAYLVLGADGKIYGLVQIPDEAWIFGDLKIASADLDFALGGQTTVNVNNTSFENTVKDAFGNISGYGGVAYTGKLMGWPYRIYYIFQDKKVNLKFGKLREELAPFDPNPYSLNQMSLLDTDSGEQVGIMVMNDNLTLLGSSEAEGTGLPALSVGTAPGETITASVYGAVYGAGIAPLSVGTNDADGNGVTITQTDENEQSYQVEVADSAPDTDYLAFSLTPDESWAGTAESFMNSLTVQKSGEGSPLGLVPAEFNDDGEVTNSGTANVILGEDCITLKLPGKGTWTISSNAAAFDISCYYARPYASFTGMNLSGTALTGTAIDMDSEADYILRTYLGTQEGGTDYLLSQSGVPSDGGIDETLSLSGSVAPTGSYYVTTVLLEEISGDFNGDGGIESAYVTTDTFAFDTTVNYTNSEQPDPPTDVSLTATGSELMRVRWKVPAAGPGVDGYYIRLYQQNGGDWTETGANYLLKASDLTADAEGYYTFDMAVTVGDKTLHLEADNTYKAGITAFRYLADEDGDGTDDSLPVEGGEAQSGGAYLPEATYPVLSYSPAPSSDVDSMKLLYIKGATQITVTSDVAADIAVTRMDTDTVVAQTPGPTTTLTFDTPADFTGALNLKITAADADGDITVDYIGLRLDDTAPLITLDSDSFKADRNTGAFTAGGVTESRARVTVTDAKSVRDNPAEPDTTLDADEVTADENGVFTITGRLNPEDTENERSAADSATLILCASDTADNTSTNTFAQIVRSEKTTYGGGGSDGSSPSIHSATIHAGTTGSISAGSLKTAAQAAGEGGTITVETSGSSVSVTGEGLQFLIDSNCALRLTTGSGAMLISAGTLAGLEITADSRVEFVLSRPEIFGDPELQALADAGYPVYEISILIDGAAVHNLTGTIAVTLEDSVFPELDSLRVIHALDSGAYREIMYTLTDGTLSFTLDSLSHVCVLDGETAAGLLKNPFIDVTSNDWFYDNVRYVYQTGLMTGTGLNTFSPYTGMTRAMAVTVLYRLSGDTGSYINSFTDVVSGAWYEDAVAWAAANRIAGGTGNGCFAPDIEITREQFAVLMHNYAKHKGRDVSVGEDTNILSYNDALNISDYAYAALQWACGAGIINGDSNGKLNPQSSATRAEVAAILERFVEKAMN